MKIHFKKMKRKKYKFLVLIGVLLLIFYAALATELIKISPIICWNFTASEPRGIYRIVAFTELKNGDMVVMRAPTTVKEYFSARGWPYEKMTPLLKTVHAVENDSYLITDKGIFVNDKYVGPVFAKDRNGLELPVLRGNFVVKKRCFLPLAVNIPNSFDGRYFGETPIELIVYKVEPFIILEGLFNWLQID